jgi:hypothetical protein
MPPPPNNILTKVLHRYITVSRAQSIRWKGSNAAYLAE